MAVNDCLSSATAGLNSSSIDRAKRSKREQYLLNQSRASSGALQLEDVGMRSRKSHSRSGVIRIRTGKQQQSDWNMSTGGYVLGTVINTDVTQSIERQQHLTPHQQNTQNLHAQIVPKTG